jgi:glycosyltransferase involved in cell wall biosynthesis
MNVLLLSKYSRNGASSRVRSLQYLPALREHGIAVDVRPLFPTHYLDAIYSRSTARGASVVVRSYLKRVLDLARMNPRYDAVWMEKELLPWIPFPAERLVMPKNVPLIVDYDDAIFVKYEQASSAVLRRLLANKIGRILRSAALVVAGSDHLAGELRRRGAGRVVTVPSSVRLAGYPSEPAAPSDGRFRIGWIGTPYTAQYLMDVTKPLEQLTADGEATLVVIGAKNLPLGRTNTVYLEWSERAEAEMLSHIDVGIMPLPASAWAAGKCGYKLIQYMAAWKPVVASPIGANRAIVHHGHNGFLASTPDEWRECLVTLKQDAGMRHRFGIAGRRMVEESYSVESNAPKLEQAIRNVRAAA